MALTKKELTELTREMLYARYDGRCSFCGDPLEERWHISEIKPIKSVVKGDGTVIIGDESYENKLPSCRSCNLTRIQLGYGEKLDIEQFRNSIYHSSEFLQSNADYKKLIRFGLIEETPKRVVFYFERFNDGNHFL